MKSMYQNNQPLMKMAPDFDVNPSRPYVNSNYAEDLGNSQISFKYKLLKTKIKK